MTQAHRSHRARRPLVLHGAVAGLVTVGLLLTGCSSAESGGSANAVLTSTTDSRDLPSSTTPGTDTASPTPTTTLPSVTMSDDKVATCVQSAVSAMNTAQRAGQLIMAGTPLSSADDVTSVMKKSHLGSAFLHGRSSRSASGLKREISRLPAMTAGKATIKPLVSIDQEGGAVQSLRGGAWGTFPTARVQGTWTASKLASQTDAWAKNLARAGVTMDLAPVADTVPSGTESRNAPIGKYGRQYGSNSTKVAAAITTVTTRLNKAGVIATVKHFPGLGRVTGNTDTTSRVIDSKTTTHDAYLRPFQAGITAGAGAVMVSSAIYTKIDPDHQAVFSSKVITDLLRGQMGYRGVVMTDDVGAAKAVSAVSPGNRAVRFIAAGGDLVLTVEPGLARTMLTAITAKAATSATFRAQVKASATRVLALKQKAGLLTCRS